MAQALGEGEDALRQPGPGHRRPLAGTLLRTALWLLLGGWVGSWACFGILVAPTVFRELPEAAPALIGPVLTGLHLYGAVAGLGIAGIAWLLGRGPVAVGLPLVMTTACLYSQFGVSGEIAEIRDQAFGPSGSEVVFARFRHLHRVSMGIYLVVSACALWLVALHARADTPSGEG